MRLTWPPAVCPNVWGLFRFLVFYFFLFLILSYIDSLGALHMSDTRWQYISLL
jgi:hypothetical protein